jgi:hypothetical protein
MRPKGQILYSLQINEHAVSFFVYTCKSTPFLISNFHRVLNVVFFLLVDFPASEFYVPTFLNTLSVPSSEVV